MKFPRPVPRRLLQGPGNASTLLTFRTARIEDQDPLYRTCYGHYSRPYFEAGFQRVLREQAAGRSVQLVAEVAGAGIVGSGQLVRYSGSQAEIADLVVSTAWRNQGVGTALIQVLTQIARAGRIWHLEIGVTDDNERALALYRRLGFLPEREVTLPGGGSAFFLVKELAHPVKSLGVA